MKTTTLPMGKVNVATLKAKLSHYLRKVKAGVEITILEHKRPVAKIVPIEDQTPLESTGPAGNFATRIKNLKIPPRAKTSIDSLTLLLEERGSR